MTTCEHDARVAFHLLPEGQRILSEEEALDFYNDMTPKECERVARRFWRMCGAFQRPMAAWIQCVQDEINAIAENLPPDM